MKRFAMVICILLCCMAAGCTKKDTPDNVKTGETKADQEKPEEKQSGMQVTVWLDAENEYAIRNSIGIYEHGEEGAKGIEESEQYYQDISWNIVDKSYLTPEQYRRELQEALDKGEGPDIIYMDTYNGISPQDMMESGRLAEIEDPVDVFGKDVDYFAGTLEAGQQDGKQYVLPTAIQCPVLFGIKDDLEEAGIDTEGGYANIQEMLGALLAAHEATGRDILEDTQALDWLEQYYVDEGDEDTRKLLAQVRECCGNDTGTFAAYDALDGKKALLGGCGVADNRKIGQNLCLMSKGQQPAFLYVPAADGINRTVIQQAVGVNAQSEHAAEISRTLLMFRDNLWLAYIVGMGPFAKDRDYWKLNMNSYVYSVAEISDRRYAAAYSELQDKIVSDYRNFIGNAVMEASYAVQPAGGLTAGQDGAASPGQERKVITVLYSDYGMGEESGTGRWLRKAAEDFNAGQEEYYVHLMRTGEATMMFTGEYMMAADGAAPDIVLFQMLEMEEFRYADMSEFLKQHREDLSFLPDSIAGGIGIGESTAGLPYAAEEYGIWCNRQTLRDAGLSEDWKPQNMQELTEGLRLLKSAAGIRTAAAMDGGFFRYLFTCMDPEHLDTYLSRNSKGEWQVSAQVWAEYMEALQQFREEGLAVPLAWRNAGITEEEAASGLADGTVGAVLSNSMFGGWYDGAHGLKLADGQREQIVFVPLSPMAYMDMFCISADCRYPEAAAEFWLSAVTHESYAQLETDNGMMPLTELSDIVQAAMPCQKGGAYEDDIVNGIWQMEKAAGEIAGDTQWFEAMEN